LFRLLGLHPGNEFGLPAVVSLSGLEPPQPRALLDTLVGAHLLERRHAGRYEFHDLLPELPGSGRSVPAGSAAVIRPTALAAPSSVAVLGRMERE
jgi:hypothetical protein